MGIFVLASLVLKRQLEKNKRPWRIWLWDVSKQLAGQAVIHGLNLLISDQLALAAHNNPCSVYFLNVLIDTTIGVAIFYFSLKGWTWVFSKQLHLEGFQSGHYGVPPKPSFWWKQLIPYILSIIVMKLLVLLPLTLPRISDLLLRFGHFLLQSFAPSVQVVFVMAFFPLVMNIVQFCIVDQVIKASGMSEEDGADEYQRIPTEGDVEAPAESPAQLHRNLRSKLASPLSSPRHRKSPLLTSAEIQPTSNQVIYGSTGTSPSPSPGDDAAVSTWVRMARRRVSSDGSTIHPDGSEDTLGLYRESRSGAPSPDSAMGPRLGASLEGPPRDRIDGDRLRRSLSPSVSPRLNGKSKAA
ncbi:Vaculolar membrane protein-domain-containing protein [Kockovaella imperatae]|uniref:Vaculolar membrane protein-domain-containing protein n=1 Tax=Kockovaella imperatae TaxID=4999 RepID=A0A1Y1UTC0_9TREE|nr:Vaculolar membrane protein-domain-containing protein [Kockovaella imperatae]ORX41273.1 Vaculolar membrane protein-domain-containing protein [Kockovaella imperatae]